MNPTIVIEELTIWSKQADKTLAGAGAGFSFFGGREDKYQNAVDLYIQAANAFKMQKLGECVVD
jgi:hypothetical protein